MYIGIIYKMLCMFPKHSLVEYLSGRNTKDVRELKIIFRYKKLIEDKEKILSRLEGANNISKEFVELKKSMKAINKQIDKQEKNIQKIWSGEVKMCCGNCFNLNQGKYLYCRYKKKQVEDISGRCDKWRGHPITQWGCWKRLEGGAS